ncbi:MAG: NlpC/P60 family protein, partial [Acidimicrobiales bacterium]
MSRPRGSSGESINRQAERRSLRPIRLAVAIALLTGAVLLVVAGGRPAAASPATYSFGGYTFSTAGDSAPAQTVIAAAASRLGMPYVYGGGSYAGPTGAASYCSNGIVTAPGSSDSGMGQPCVPAFAAQSGQPGFDCSGLVMYAMAQVGVYLPHYSGSWGDFGDVQAAGGFTTDVAELVPGDLVFFEGATDPQHVGIYIGNNHMIDAYDTGNLVQVDTVSNFVVPFVEGGPAWQVPPQSYSTTGMSVTPNSTIAAGGAATVTATLSPDPGGGYVGFYGRGGVFDGCAAVPVVGAQASCTVSDLPIGSDEVTANYLGDTNFGGSMGSLTLTVLYPQSRVATIPLPNGTVDYCRQVGMGPDNVGSYLSCTSFDPSTNSFGPTATSPVLDWGYTNGSEQWVPTANGSIDYCRQVGMGPDNVGSYLSCTSFDPSTNSFGPTATSPVLDWG